MHINLLEGLSMHHVSISQRYSMHDLYIFQNVYINYTRIILPILMSQKFTYAHWEVKCLYFNPLTIVQVQRLLYFVLDKISLYNLKVI